MANIRYTGDALWNRIERAVDKVRERLRRVTAALDAAAVEYAVIGGNAVQVWVAHVDEAAVRNTRDVDILIRRDDLLRVIDSLGQAGFVFRQASGDAMFLDGPRASARDAVHIVFAQEMVCPEHVLPAPDVTECEKIQDLRTITLEALVRMKLTAFRRKDQVHLLDMLEVELIDQSWLGRLPEVLRSRLQELIDNPDQ